MKLKRLAITNYGPFSERNVFNLQTTPERPLVLFGGKNGAGKTTLFRAVQLCLHGRSAFGRRTSRQEYESRIKSRLHQSGSQKAKSATIQLQFEYGNFGDTDDYVVERTWRDRGKSLDEDITIKRNGSKLSDLNEDQWESFLKELIPPGVSQLFFFDGEQVQDLARAIEHGNDFEDSLYSLLGLNMVERLDADLSIYLSRKLNESGHEELAEEIECLRGNVDRLETEYDDIREKIETKETKIGDLTEKIDRKEQELASEGGAFAEMRNELRDRRTHLETRIEGIREAIREIAKDAYPFALAPELCRQVKGRLKKEMKNSTREAALDEVVHELDDLTAEEEIWDEVDVPPERSAEIIQKIQSQIQGSFAQESETEYLLSKEFSERERQEMYSVVDEALNEVPVQLKELSDNLEEATRELQQVQQQLSQAPEQSVISPIVEEINEYTEKRGRLKSEVQKHQQELEELETKIGRKENQLENRLSEQEGLEDVSDRAELASDVRGAVQDYRTELARKKLQRLETTLTERYISLTNKPDFYERVIIDPDEVTIELETVRGDRKDQSQLSAGERQIFATALLWALADISDRPLPFMIDTPLGRLDQEHRGNVVRHFFPEAAHQVILFSTDTEITEEFYNDLEENISVEYHLEYDEDRGQTDISPGYFWSSGVATETAAEGPVIETEHHVQLGEVDHE